MPYLTNRWVWAAGVISTSLVMVSGQMFVQIRGMPYAGHGGQKIAPGFQQQFGDEVHFISIICMFDGILYMRAPRT
jgi:oligosaccharyltransferase complex subunit gamma